MTDHSQARQLRDFAMGVPERAADDSSASKAGASLALPQIAERKIPRDSLNARLSNRAASVPRIRGLVLIYSVLGCTVMASAEDQSAVGISSAASLSSDIAAQPLADALSEFARQSGLQLVYVSEIARARQSKGARAGQPPAAAPAS